MKAENTKYRREEVTNTIKFHKECVNSAGCNVQVHFHDYIEILYAFGGEYSIWLDGKCFDFSTGDLVLINSCKLHHIVCKQPAVNGGYYCIQFLPSILYESTRKVFEFKYVMPFLTNHTPPQSILPASEISNSEIPRLMYDMYKETQRQDYAFEFAMKADVYKIFLYILRYWHKAGLNAGKEVNIDLAAKIQNVIDYMSSHYNEPLTAEQMAENANLSYSYFSRIFKQVTERSFSEYLNYIRISESEKLLLTTDMNITEIALAVGFSTSSYYIQQFKHYKNLSPKQFKKQLFNS
ncbi:MAG: helix-turn-helix transcriptional regulator [Clostridia bacterium]|nr:helix-turn-helix transcriptional regulator [Clostridia bacterium]